MSVLRGSEGLSIRRGTLEGSTCEIELQIKNNEGLHMRPAMQFVDVASRFPCTIKVSNGEIEADGKSIMQMSMLAATCGTKLKVRAEGEEADQAVYLLVRGMG